MDFKTLKRIVMLNAREASRKDEIPREARNGTRAPGMTGILILFLVLFLLPLSADAAVLALISPNKSASVGQKIEVFLLVDPEAQSINAVEGKISYSGNLKLDSINDGDTILPFWVERPAVLADGRISFSGIVPGGYKASMDNAGLSINAGKIFKLIFTAKNPGPANINIEAPKVLLNDGAGTEAKLTAYGLAFSVSGSGVAPEASLPPEDITPPEKFSPGISRDPNIFENKWFLVFKTRDGGSGIDYYEVSEKSGFNFFGIEIVGFGGWERAESPYLLKDQSLKSYIYARAVDRSGNRETGVLRPENTVPWYRSLLFWSVILIIVAASTLFRYRKVILWAKRMLRQQ